MGYFCSVCKEAISEKVYEYSLEHWSKAFCMKHQELEKQKLFCQKCKKPISKTVYDYSIGHFSKPLCFDCQQYHHRMAVKGDNTFEGKGFYCNKCKMTITYPTYRYSMRMYGTPLCKDCQEDQWQYTFLLKFQKPLVVAEALNEFSRPRINTRKMHSFRVSLHVGSSSFAGVFLGAFKIRLLANS